MKVPGTEGGGIELDRDSRGLHRSKAADQGQPITFMSGKGLAQVVPGRKPRLLAKSPLPLHTPCVRMG